MWRKPVTDIFWDLLVMFVVVGVFVQFVFFHRQIILRWPAFSMFKFTPFLLLLLLLLLVKDWVLSEHCKSSSSVWLKCGHCQCFWCY